MVPITTCSAEGNTLAVHHNIKMELKCRQNETWPYPGGEGRDFYTGDGKWQRLEARIDPSQISDLERVQSITRNAATGSIPAYCDDIQLMTETPAATRYDVQVATDVGFTNVIQNETSVQSGSVEAGFLTKGTTYLSACAGREHGRHRPVGGLHVHDARPRAAPLLREGPYRRSSAQALGSIRAVVDPDASGSEVEQRRWSRTRSSSTSRTAPLSRCRSRSPARPGKSIPVTGRLENDCGTMR